MTEATLSIGEVAERVGASVSAIRFYEREGLLPEAERVGGQRRFTEETVRRLGIIDVAKQAGFSLEEVGVLLTSVDRGAPAHKQLQALAARKLPEVDALLARAQAMRDWLTTASECGCDSLEDCALFVDASRTWTLIGRDGRPYESDVPGTLGGHRRTRIYGRLDCAGATRAIARGGYVQNRIFFLDEETAVAAGYRPCARCMPEEYRRWKERAS